MSESTPPASPSSNGISYREIAIAIPIALYVCGYLLTSSYLGAFGITQFSLLRPRYILVGGALCLYIAMIAVPLWGFVHMLVDSRDITKLRLLWRASAFVFSYAGAVLLATLALGQLSGFRHPVAVLWPPVSFQTWQFLLVLSLSIVVTAILTGPQIWPYNRTRSRENLENTIMEYVWLLYVIGFYRWGGRLFNPPMTLEGIAHVNSSFALQRWNITVIGFVVIGGVTMLASYVGIMYHNMKRPGISGFENPPYDKVMTKILLATSILLIVVPVYVHNIYPALARHLGGAAIVPVERVQLTRDISWWSPAETEIYLMEETARGVVFLTINRHDGNRRVLEIAADSISAIEYQPFDVPASARRLVVPSLSETVR